MPSAPLEASSRQHRAFEFGKGFFIPFLVAIPCLATYLPVEYLIEKYRWNGLDNLWFLFTAVVVISLTVILARRWRTTAPTRAKGVVWGAFLTPFLLIALFLAWLTFGNVQMGPR